MAGNDEAGSLETLLSDGWGDHEQDSDRLGRELEAAVGAGIAPGLLVSFLHLATHTFGEHLGDWPRALAVGKRALDGQTPVATTAKAWGWLHVAAVLAGDPVEAAAAELSCLKAAGDEFGAALLEMRFMLAQALVGAGRAREGARIYRGALDVVGQVGPSARLDRTIAVASNNLGWELYEMASRTPDDDAVMRLAAATSLAAWLKCGTWINAERAHYLVARVDNVTGDPASGLAHADAALAIIAANGERPLDTALLNLARAVSLGALGDRAGSVRAVGDADAAAAKLAAADLKAQFAAERAEVAADVVVET
jgi:hypothetical protein